MKDLVIYTDGAFSSKRNAGGIGIVILLNDKKLLEYSNQYKRTSNNQMELAAVIVALRLIKESYDSITIYSDSMYVIGCATLGWKRKKNVLLWNEFDKQYKRVSELCPNIVFKHIKGHQSVIIEANWNNYVDNLAVKASQLV